MYKKILGFLQYFLFLGLGFFLVWWSLHKIGDKGVAELKQTLLGANYLLMLPVFLLMLLSHWSRAVRWKILIEPLGYRPRMANIFFAVMIGYLANLAVPRLGEVLKCTILGRYEKVPPDKLVGTIVAERAFDLICLLIIFGITILLQVDIVGEYAATVLRKLFKTDSGDYSFTRIAIVLGIIIALVLVMRFILKRFAHIAFISKIRGVIKGIWLGLTSVRFIKQKKWFFAHTVFIWAMYLVSTRLGFYAIESTAHMGMKESFSVLSFGSIGMIVTPGGIGAYPAIIMEIMQLYKLPEQTGYALGTLLWAAQTIIVLLAGAACLLLLPWYNKKRPHETK
jgi:glycosyltransferase 2 family protein